MTEFILRNVKRYPLPYSAYRKIAKKADILLWEPHGLTTQIIADGTGGPFCHASMADWVYDRLFEFGYEEGRDGYGAPLSAAVKSNSGKIHVFRYLDIDEEERTAIAKRIIGSLGGKYQWTNIRLIAWLETTFGRFSLKIPFLGNYLQKKLETQTRMRAGAICSQCIARAYEDEGHGIIRKIPSLVSPNDIGRSTTTAYICSIEWDKNWVK